MKRNTLLVVVVAASVLLVFSAFSFLNTETTVIAEPDKSSFDNSYKIFSVNYPKDLMFCDEEVPLSDFDIYESFDKEMLVNTYWQSQTVLFIKRSNKHFPIIEPILKAQGVPDDFKYLAVAESGLTNASSPAGAKGYWQFLKGTAKEYGLEVNEDVDERYHIEKSTEAAAKYLTKSYNKFGKWSLVAASYNMGTRNTVNQIARQKADNYFDLVLGEETGRYVYRILAIKTILESPEDFGFHVEDKDKYHPVPYETVVVDTAISDLADFAKSQGINYKILKELNPWLRNNKLTNANKKSYGIKIAKGNLRNTSR